MKFSNPIPVKEMAARIKAQIIGDNSTLATGINEIHQVQEGDVTFVDIEKYYDKALNSRASIIILNKKTKCPPGKTLLLCDSPFEAFNNLVLDHRPYRPLTTTISPDAQIASTAIIEPNVVIGPGVIIGEHCHIQANVT